MSIAIDHGSAYHWQGMVVPKAPSNRHYRRLQAAIDAGDVTVEPYVPPEPSIDERRAAALREHISDDDLRDMVVEIIDQQRGNWPQRIRDKAAAAKAARDAVGAQAIGKPGGG